MYDIFVYLFENCRQADLAQNNDLIVRKLSAAGFDDTDISEALSWLAGVVRTPHRCAARWPEPARAFRVYAPKECAKLDAASRGLIMHLEAIGVLDPGLRELVIDRAMAAAGRALSIHQVRLIVLMVLWNLETPASRLMAEELLAPTQDRLAN